MDIHHNELSDIQRYIESNKDMTLEEKEQDFEVMLGRLGRFRGIDGDTKILEIGPGTGWFSLLCKKKGISCKGLEISPALVEFAKELGGRYGLEPDIELGNIEETDLGTSNYDIVMADSVFEHVEDWQEGLRKVFRSMKPGGVLLFISSNRFAPISGEFNFPFYGWMPDSWRYRLRRFFQGDDIMKLGIDFNQFTYFQLRPFLKDIGFSSVMDWIDFVDPEVLNNSSFLKRSILRMVIKLKFLKSFFLFFSPVTSFMCIK